MLIVWILLALMGCVLSGIGAALFTRARVRREQLLAEIEDPRDTHIRELLVAVKVERENAARAMAGQRDGAEALAQARERIQALEKSAVDTAADMATRLGHMDSLLGERNQLEKQLAGMRHENEQLRSRAEELEVALSMGKVPDLLDPGLQAS